MSAGDRAGFERVAINGKHELRFGDENINLHFLHQIAHQSQKGEGHFGERRVPPWTRAIGDTMLTVTRAIGDAILTVRDKLADGHSSLSQILDALELADGHSSLSQILDALEERMDGQGLDVLSP
ncbi:hypothetical protein T484DRAFT_1825757, partial [Baffinella frigidus]